MTTGLRWTILAATINWPISHVSRTLRACLGRQAPNASRVARDAGVGGAVARRALADLSRPRDRAGTRVAGTHGRESARVRVLPVLAQSRDGDRLERRRRRCVLRAAARSSERTDRWIARAEPLDSRPPDARARSAPLAGILGEARTRRLAIDSADDRARADRLRSGARDLPSHDARARPHRQLGARDNGRAPADHIF